MNRRILVCGCLMLPLLLSSCATTDGIDNSRLGELATDLGISSEQAQAGTGAMLKLAQLRMEPAEFQRLAGAIPRANEYMALASRLGAFQGITPTAGGLGSAFDKIGITPEQAAKFVPAVADFVSGAAGRDVGLAFANAMK